MAASSSSIGVSSRIGRGSRPTGSGCGIPVPGVLVCGSTRQMLEGWLWQVRLFGHFDYVRQQRPDPLNNGIGIRAARPSVLGRQAAIRRRSSRRSSRDRTPTEGVLSSMVGARVPDLSITERVRVLAPALRIWRALTAPAELIEWYAPGCRWEVAGLARGSTVRFFNTETDVQNATVEEAAPPHQLVLRWQIDAEGSVVDLFNSFTLDPDGPATIVTIRQAGYEALPEGVRDQWLDQDRGAFRAIASALKAYVETVP